MSALLTAFLSFQIVAAQSPGAVTGIVRGADGKPAARVRVYATPAREGAQNNGEPAALEGLAETGADGRYRLELPPGRYYVASGSVTVPTYYPGTANVSSARPIDVRSGGVVEAIDFGSYVPAARDAVPPLGSAELSGVLRYPDGTPAGGITVAAIPSGVPVRLPLTFSSVTDATGRYRIERLASDNFSIVAEYSDAPVFYPGTKDVAAASSIATTPTTKLDNLDFVIPRFEGTTLSGRVRTNAASGSVRLIPAREPAAPSMQSLAILPGRTTTKEKTLGERGEFEFTDVAPGAYTLQVSFPDVPPQLQTLFVDSRPVRGLDFLFLIASLSGRLVMEDGSPVPVARTFDDAIAVNPASQSIPFSITAAGTFSGSITNGEYRFLMREIPEEYEVVSINAGGKDILRELLKVAGDVPVAVEIRVSRKTLAADNEGQLRGVVLDSVSGLPASAERIQLCCLRSGLAEKLSAPVNANGSFEFASVPPGKYSVRLQVKSGNPDLYVGGATVEVDGPRPKEVVLYSATEFREVMANVVFSNVPSDLQPQIVFVSVSGRVEIRAERNASGTYRALLPAGDRYGVSARNLPQGYVVKSASGPLEVPFVSPRAISLAPMSIIIGRLD